MSLLSFDLTPAPNVLIALTHTPMQPLDALCELIDNAIDSFSIGEFEGLRIANPTVLVQLPRPAEIETGSGHVSVQDNGPGMTHEIAERAIKAGFSGNNPYDSLGLFGMGFNIATGKLGRSTRLLTARRESSVATEVSFDLQELVKRGSYLVPGRVVDKPLDFSNGTFVEVTNWWPDGHANSGFVAKLVRYGSRTIREELGRRYASILRRNKVRILVNGEPCVAYEHCAWSPERYVVRNGGQVPAVFNFREVVGSQKRCVDCFALVPPEDSACPSCKSGGFRTIEERISGWLGIQRYDSDLDYGIDLVRNGRTIRVQEKAAFFEFADELKRTMRDYPIDQPYGRIIGEVELNHVPVDFMKQDFQRSSMEWQRAMSFLRGTTSLQPSRSSEGSNSSPMFKLYQGYRRVRTPGKTDLYMGFWNADEGKPKRISREKEKELLQRFTKKEAGYFDDSEWYRFVEQADKPPPAELVNCPQCDAQVFASEDVCTVCGFTLKAKTCIAAECGKPIPETALSCPHCGVGQVPEVLHPWTCKICRTSNAAATEVCTACTAVRGLDDPLSIEALLNNSSRSDELSLKAISFLLPDGSRSAPALDVNVNIVNLPLRAFGETAALPAVVFKGETIDIFIDVTHPMFRAIHSRPEDVVATEVALFICDNNRRFAAGRYSRHFSISSMKWQVLSAWTDRLADSPEHVRADIAGFLQQLRERLPKLLLEQSGEIFAALDDDAQKTVVTAVINNRQDIAKLSAMVEDGDVLQYLPNKVACRMFSLYPEPFFEGGMWTDSLGGEFASALVKAEVVGRLRGYYGNLLEDVVAYLETTHPAPLHAARARLSHRLLTEKIA